MSRAVLISIRPEWAAKIATGEKTVEIRKTRPNLETPFKCYIYETQGKSDTPWIDEDGHMIFRGCGKVVGEFVCDRITGITLESMPHPELDGDWTEYWYEWEEEDLKLKSCLTYRQIEEYLNRKDGYAWHISKLEIYDTPKPLSEFSRPFENCIDKVCDEYGCAYCKNGGHIKRPPQSWCYVEELQ